jgi:Sodium/hydrogen exchanger family
MLLLVGAILAGSITVALGAARIGVPSLVAFLALGILLGSDGPGGTYFDDAELARTVGIIALAAILFEGGISTSWRRLRQVAVPAVLLETVGVVVTAVLTGAAAYYLFDLSWLESVLLGAVVASTDAAAVFATLRFTRIRRRLARTLEAETGLNDPVAIALTIGLIEWIDEPSFDFPDLALPRSSSARPRTRCWGRSGCSGDVAVRPPSPHARRVRSRGVRCGGSAVVRRSGRDRRQRLPGRLPRQPRRRKYAVAIPPSAGHLPRGTRLPRPGDDVRRLWVARVPKRSAAGRAGGTGASGAPDDPDPPLGGLDLDGV